MKEKKHTKKTTSDKKKGKDSIPIINEPVAKVEVVKTREEEAEELYKQVSEINTQLIEEGNKVLMETLPEKIKQLSEYIKVRGYQSIPYAFRTNLSFMIHVKILIVNLAYQSMSTRKNSRLLKGRLKNTEKI